MALPPPSTSSLLPEDDSGTSAAKTAAALEAHHTAPLLELQNIQLSRAGRNILKNISLTLHPGECLILTGPNGSGKSSLLRMIAHLCPPSDGSVQCYSPFEWLGPDNALKPTLTVEQNLCLLKDYPLTELHTALNTLKLARFINTPIRLLSLGQKRRVAFTRLLLSKAPLWLLDEPANGLDAQSRSLLESLISQHLQKGGAVVMASHTPLNIPYSYLLTFTPPETPTLPTTTHIIPPTNTPHHSSHSATSHPSSSLLPLTALIKRELFLTLRHGAETLAAMLFLLICSALFPLALGPNDILLQQAGGGILWVCALLTCLLPLERLYNADADDGSLELLHVHSSAMPIALGKIITHWLVSGLPIVLLTPLLSLFFHLSTNIIPTFMLSLTLGSMTLSLIGGMTAALTLGARRNSLLLPILTLPLMTPSLIFGVLTTTTTSGTSPASNMSLLAAFFCLALPICPFLAGVALKDAQH